MRHLTSWWEGENVDPDSGLSHVTKAIATLTVLRDAMLTGKYSDDRPPALPAGWLVGLNEKAGEIIPVVGLPDRARRAATSAAYSLPEYCPSCATAVTRAQQAAYEYLAKRRTAPAQ
jgi:hypothetical protein